MSSLMYARQPDNEPIYKGTLDEYLFGHKCKRQVFSRPNYTCGAGNKCRRASPCPKIRACFQKNTIIDRDNFSRLPTRGVSNE